MANKVDIQINADVKGRESVDDLATRLEGLADVLDGEVKTRAQEAAAQLRELARQDAAIDQFGLLRSAVSESGRALKAAEAEAANFGKQIAAAGPPTAQEAAALQALLEASDAIRESMAQQQEALAGATTELQAFGVSASDTDRAQERLRAQMEQVRASIEDIAPAYDGAKGSASELEAAMTALGLVSDESLLKTAEVARVAYETLKAAGTASTRELQAAFREYAERAIAANAGVVTEAMRTEAAMRGLQITTDSAGRTIVTAMGAAEQATGGFLDSMRGKIMAVGAAIASYFTVDFFAGAVRGSGDLEQALDRVQSATNGTAAEMALLRKAAEESGVDSIAAAGALENLAKAGLNAKDAIGALPAVLSLAKAGDVELGEAAEFLTKAVMGMGLKFSETARVADVLAAGANATNTSVKGLAEGLSYAAPVAQSLGLSLETTVAIIGKFADAGIDASRAGTALNSVLSQFGDPASKFRGELAAAGITTGNFETALHQLAAAGPRGAKAINAVGMEAGPALRALLNQGMPALDELVKKLGSAEGAAAAAAAVMDANLNGALASLGVAWKYVKDTLGTPVLPVITSAVSGLTAALRGAVQDGTVGKFGEALAAGFQSGIKWAKDFLAQIDFKQIGADLRAFADRTGEVFAKIGEHASTAGNTVKLAYGVMSAGANSVLALVYGLGSAFAEMASKYSQNMAVLYDGLAKFSLGPLSERYKQAAEEARNAAQGFGEAAQAMQDKAAKAMQDVAESAQLARDGFTGLATSATSAAPALGATADKMSDVNAAIAAGDWDLVTKKINDLTATTAKATPEVEALQKVLNAAIAAGDWDRVTKTLNELGSVTKEAKVSNEAAAVSVRQLRDEYDALIKKGDLQGAADKIKEINNALQATGPASKDAIKAAQKAAEELDAAFTGMGITSQASLRTTADSYRVYYERIKADGTSTAVDIANAWKAYADKAIAANNGVAPSWVAAQAAAHSYEVQVDSSGKATVKAMQDGAKSIKTVEDAYRQLGLKTPEELGKVAEANKAAWDKIKSESSTGADTLKAAFQAYATAALAAAGDVGSEQRLVTQELLTTEAAAKGLSVAFDAAGKMIVESQRAAHSAIGNTTSALERQNDALEKTISAQEKANELAARRNALERERLNIDKEGYTLNTNGQRVNMQGDTRASVYSQAKGAGLDEAAALKIADRFISGNGERIGAAGAISSKGENWSTELQKAISAAVLAAAQTKADSTKSTQSTPATGTQAGPSYVTNITLPSGGTQTVRMQDADSQSIVNDLLRQLAAARGTAIR